MKSPPRSTRSTPRLAAALGLLVANGCATSDDTAMRPPAERVTYSDPLAVPLAAVTHESLDPVAFKVDRGILVALTGRFPATGATPVARALQFVSSHASLFSRTGAAPALKLRRTTSEVLGDRTIDVVVLRQQFDGIDVYAAELSILLHGNAVI